MTGLRKRVKIGFMSIVGVLILAGMVSFFELTTLSNDTDDILDSNRRTRLLAREMLSAVRDHNRAFMQMTIFEDRSIDSLSGSSLDHLDKVLSEARIEEQAEREGAMIDSMIVISKQIRYITERFVAAPFIEEYRYKLLREEVPHIDSISMSFQRNTLKEYQPLYHRLVAKIDEYMTMAHNSLAPGAEKLENNAYRAVIPVFISLLTMIVTVLMLFYFIMIYCVNPIISINDALKNYLTFKMPYSPKCNKKDELQQLNERIESIIATNKILTKDQ